MKDVLYIGSDHINSTSTHRAMALTRLGHKVSIYNPWDALQKFNISTIFGWLHFRTGYRLIQPPLMHWLSALTSTHNKPDLVWINSGELIGPGCLKILKGFDCPIVLYVNDDPTGNRDGRRFDMLKKSLQWYDLCVVVRKVNVDEFINAGAKRIVHVRMSYDEIAHQNIPDDIAIPENFKSEVAFIGTWMRNEGRDSFLLNLIKQGLEVSIWGNRWGKSKLWKHLRHYWRGPALYGSDYVMAIKGAKVCLGLLSKGNRDLHTQRSVEIPFAGGLLCAERTPEHLEMYREDEEAIFWSDVTECAQKCLDISGNYHLREKIRLAGQRRVKQLGVGNEDMCKAVLENLQNHPDSKIIHVNYGF